MKTNLNAADLMMIHDLLMSQLRICNHSDGYKNNCKIIAKKISDSLSKIKIELKDAKRGN